MKQDRVYVVHILDMISNVEDLTVQGREAFMAAKHDRAAVLHYLQTMAKSTQRLSDEIKATHPEIDWDAISGFRNRLVHGYLDINMDVVWSVIADYLPDLKYAAEAMVEDLDRQNSDTDKDKN